MESNAKNVVTRESVLAAVTKNGWALDYASPELRADREIVLAAVTKNGGALKWASPDLRADREVVLVAVTENGWALEYASPELRADREIVLAAMESDESAVNFASEELRDELKLVVVDSEYIDGNDSGDLCLQLTFSNRKTAKVGFNSDGEGCEHFGGWEDLTSAEQDAVREFAKEDKKFFKSVQSVCSTFVLEDGDVRIDPACYSYECLAKFDNIIPRSLAAARAALAEYTKKELKKMSEDEIRSLIL